MPRRPFQLDLRIKTNGVAFQKGASLRGHIGVYFPGTNDAYVFLKPIKEWVETYVGNPASERMLIQAITETACHETLHSLVKSSGPNAGAREHRAIARLMAAAGMEWRY